MLDGTYLAPKLESGARNSQCALYHSDYAEGLASCLHRAHCVGEMSMHQK